MSPCHRSNLNLIVKGFLSRPFCARQRTSVNWSVGRALGNSVLHFFSSFVSATYGVASKNKYCKDLSCKDISSLLLKSVPLAVWKKDWNHLYWCRSSKQKGSRASCITTAGLDFLLDFEYILTAATCETGSAFSFVQCKTSYPLHCKVSLHQVSWMRPQWPSLIDQESLDAK